MANQSTNTYRFCPMCGKHYSKPIIDPLNQICSHCNFTYHHNLRTAVGALIINKNQLLLVKRAQKPRLGTWDTPGGFTQTDEHPEDTVVREVKEEIGIKVQVIKLFGVYAPNPYPYQGFVNYSCDLFYLVKPLSLKFTLSEEISELRWFNLNKLPPTKNIAFPTTRQALKDLQSIKHPRQSA